MGIKAVDEFTGDDLDGNDDAKTEKQFNRVIDQVPSEPLILLNKKRPSSVAKKCKQPSN
jgi:hypothetical protein